MFVTENIHSPLSLHSSTMSAHEGNLYCKSCHKRSYGLKGYGYGQGAGVLASEAGTEGTDAPSDGNILDNYCTMAVDCTPSEPQLVLLISEEEITTIS